ncbi:MAG: acetate--CoA ligase family protein [Nitrospirae bacterium]|jgi:citryl-CoA synthetase large subunit|uniref:Succinyl-CoA synthetase, beta subunit n=1 Tax=Leptospirillum ferrodiazotrophum TaxID=412449 RepID=C6HX38_9BACT|nr:MAG: Succinyl-CoA synthetase, beta subunit [Leptospirillum ferrodiazotrophum]MCL5953645.1 acetate--CoA ligase family protein [Nitrospirota bacterium]
MKLYEHEALGAIFKKYKIPVPRYIFATDMNDAVNQFVEKEPGVVVKSMVLVGKRGKAGAVKVVSDKAKVPDVVRDLATREVYGEKSIGALVEEKLDIEKEFYLSVTYSTKDRAPAIIFSEHGGMDVEEIDPKLIHTHVISDVRSVYPYQIRQFLTGIGFSDKDLLRPLSEVIVNVYHAFVGAECRLLEINPLVVARSGDKRKIVAADAVVILDDDASVNPAVVYGARSAQGRPMTQREQDAILIDQGDHRGKAGSYVELEGDIAMMTFGGGGSTVTAETAIEAGLRIANLTDIGGNPPAEKMYRISRIILSKPGIKGVLVCGGTASNTRIDVTLGEGLAKALDDMNAEGKLDKNLIWVVRRSGPEYVKGLKMLHECFVRNGIRGEIYDSQLPITEAPIRLKELLIKHAGYKPEQIV